MLAGSMAFGQKLRVSLEGGIAKPIGWQGQHTMQGEGGEVSLDYFFDDQWSLGAEIGLREFLFHSKYFQQPALRVITYEAVCGYHHKLSSYINAYGKLGLGVFQTSSSYRGDDDIFYPFTEVNAGLSPKLGFTYRLMPSLYLDMNASCSFSANRELAFVNVVVGFQYDFLKL